MTVRPKRLDFTPGFLHNKHTAARGRKRRKKMDYKKLTAIIPMISVVVMLVWGLIAKDWSQCWIAVVVGGVITGILGTLSKGQDKKE